MNFSMRINSHVHNKRLRQKLAKLRAAEAWPSPDEEESVRPIFTVHAGEYLVGEYIERTYPKWNVWVPSRDTGTDLLVTSAKNRKMVALQVKFSKDFIAGSSSPLIQSRLLGLGWWTHNPKKIISSLADFWVFVLPSFVEKRASFIIVPPSELLRRLTLVHGHRHKRISGGI